MSKNIFFRLDWLSIFIFLLLVSFGILSIYSTTFSEIQMSIFNWSTPAGKQFLDFHVLSFSASINSINKLKCF